jgi:predicted acyltransferase
LDVKILDGHLWVQTKTWDPEGILSTLPAIATGISGMLIGSIITVAQSITKRLKTLLSIGAGSVLLGLLWSTVFPFNKALWTSSYVLYTSGLAIIVFTIFYWLIDVKRIQGWSKPFLWYGVNALSVFVASGLLTKILIRTKVTVAGGEERSVWNHLYESLFTPWLSPHNASLAFAMMWVLFFGTILFVLYRKHIIIKV